MRQVLRVVLATVLGTVLVATAVPAAGAAPSAPTIRVAPSRALQDGQTVAVFGDGFVPQSNIIGLTQCRAVDPAVTACVGHKVVTAALGSFAAYFPIHRFVGSTDCAAAPGTCVIGATNLGGTREIRSFSQMAFGHLRFGPPATVLQSTLTGWREIGPDGASGAGNLGAVGAVTLAVGATSFCATLSVTGIHLPAVAAHVHDGRAGINGPIVIPLRPPGPGGRSQACVDGVDPALLARLASHPTRFYVNVHTGALPNGAVRGQLQRPDQEGVMLATRLSGANVIGPDSQRAAGDPDGSGVATLAVDPGAHRVCFELSVRRVALPGATALLNNGRSTNNGSLVVSLPAPDATGRSSACVSDADFLPYPSINDLMAADPAFFDLEVHTTAYPDGAVRGQLAPAAALAG